MIEYPPEFYSKPKAWHLKVKPGQYVFVQGHGPMRVIKLVENVFTLRSRCGYNYWARTGMVLKKSDEKEARTFAIDHMLSGAVEINRDELLNEKTQHFLFHDPDSNALRPDTMTLEDIINQVMDSLNTKKKDLVQRFGQEWLNLNKLMHIAGECLTLGDVQRFLQMQQIHNQTEKS